MNDIKDLEKQLKAFANKRRLAILAYLKKIRFSHVGDIATEIKLSFKSTSRHLAILRAAGIVESEQRDLYVYYFLNKQSEPLANYIISIV
jgi:DNA-binding transcriptional ArsR family regulator